MFKLEITSPCRCGNTSMLGVVHGPDKCYKPVEIGLKWRSLTPEQVEHLLMNVQNRGVLIAEVEHLLKELNAYGRMPV